MFYIKFFHQNIMLDFYFQNRLRNPTSRNQNLTRKQSETVTFRIITTRIPRFTHTHKRMISQPSLRHRLGSGKNMLPDKIPNSNLYSC